MNHLPTAEIHPRLRPDVILCFPLFDKVFFTEPVGALLIASYLQKAGFVAEVYDGFLRGESAETSADSMVARNPRFVGISINAERELADGLHLAAALRTRDYPGLVVAGGAFAGMARAHLLGTGNIDAVVVGDGEEAMAELLEKSGNFIPKGIAGVATADDPNPDLRAGLRGLSEVPWMDRSVFSKMITANGESLRGIQATISTDRGCFMRCAFCSIQFAARDNTGPRYRQRDIEDVVEEMSDLYLRFGIKDFYFCSAQFVTLNRRSARLRLRQFAEGVAALPFSPSIFMYLRCDNIESQVVEDLQSAGVTTIFMGVESFDDKTLKAIQKGLTSIEIVNALELLEDQGYSAHYRSPWRLKLGFIMFTPWTDLAGLAHNARMCRRFGIPPKKMLYSMQVHPASTLPSDLKLVERHSVHFAELEGPVGDVYRGFSRVIRAKFRGFEQIRAIQKAGRIRDRRVLDRSYLFLDELNAASYDAFEALVAEAASNGDTDAIADEFIHRTRTAEPELDTLMSELRANAEPSGRVCASSHLNRGLDNPQVLDPTAVELGIRYP